MWAVVLQDLGTGGAQRSMLNAASGMAATGLDIRMVSLTRGDGLAGNWADPAVPLDRLDRHRSPAAAALRRWLLRWQPKAMLCTMLDANILAALVCASLPRKLRPALVLRETNSQRARDDLGWLQKQLCRWAFRRATAVIALSSGVGAEIAEDCGIPADRLAVIGNPVKVGDIAAAVAAARAASRSSRQEPPLFLAMGRLVRQKGFDLLIEAMRLTSQPCRLVIVGDGPDRAALAQQARNGGVADRVIFAGQVSDPAQWLAQADLFILPSRWEGFGHVIVEAMAAGLPVIAADCPHGPRDIITGPEHGLLVEPNSPPALAAAMDRLLAEPQSWPAYTAAGRRRAGDFDITTISRRYAAVLTDAEARHAAH
jgi:glycosyltransferase involved in cell wall biosynthesis